MRIFVTGGTGFIGRHLCQRLIERGDEVFALVRSPKKAAAFLPAGVKTVEGDLSLFADPATVLPPCDVVIHLAAVIAADTLEQYEAINFDAVKNLLDCLGRQSWRPARMLFASSLAASGPSPAGVAHTERDPLHPIDPYGDAKARAEALVAAAPFPTTSFRPCIVLGPGDEQSLTLFRAARSGFGFRVAGAPQELSFIDVRDLVEAIVLMADDRRPGSYCYFASHPREDRRAPALDGARSRGGAGGLRPPHPEGAALRRDEGSRPQVGPLPLQEPARREAVRADDGSGVRLLERRSPRGSRLVPAVLARRLPRPRDRGVSSDGRSSRGVRAQGLLVRRLSVRRAPRLWISGMFSMSAGCEPAPTNVM